MIWRKILAWAACCGLLPLAYADPQADPVKPDEQLLIFPALCWQERPSGQWQVDLHAWIYEEPLAELDTAWRWLVGPEEQAGEPDDESLRRERLRWFVVDNERGKRLRFDVAGVSHVAAASGADGHVHDTVSMPQGWDPHTGAAGIVNAAPDGRRFAGRLACLPPQGLSVISDIDDTVKISEVHDKAALLANTFSRPYRAVSGMAPFYARLAREHGADFHYLSASPWQLYPPLAAFFEERGFPSGSFHLKHFRLKDSSFLALFEDPVTYKLELIETLFGRLGERDVILIGDSGERDPEVYGEVARRYPDRVRAIVIREVGESDQAARAQRQAVAFAGVDPARVHWFSGDVPEDLPARLFKPHSSAGP